MNKTEYLQVVLQEELFNTLNESFDINFNKLEFIKKIHNVFAIIIMLYNEHIIRFDFMDEKGPFSPQYDQSIEPLTDLQQCVRELYYYNSNALKFGIYDISYRCLANDTNLDNIELNISKILYILYDLQYCDESNINHFIINEKIKKVEKLYQKSIDSNCLQL